MLSVSGLLRKIALMEKDANAERNLKTYIGAYLRPEFNDAIDYGSILRSSEIKVPSQYKEHFDIEDIREDLVDRFIDREKAEDVRALMRAHSAKFGHNAEFLIGTTRTLDDEEKDLVKEMVKDLAPLASKYIRMDFLQGYKEWVHKHIKESPETETTPEPTVPPEHEVEEDMKKKHEWEEGLIKDTLALINRKFPQNHHIMKMILKDIYLARHPKSQKQLAEELNVSEATIVRRAQELQKALKEFYTAQGLGGKFLEEGGLVKKEIEIPKYTEIMKDPDNTKDFKEYIEPKINTKMSERTLKVVDFFAEGLTSNEIGLKLQKPENIIRDLKKTYFDPWYKKWYENKIEEIRKACIEESIMATTVRVPYKKIDDKEPKKEDKKEDLEEAMQSHKKMVERAFKNGGVVVDIGFHSEYDNVQVLSGKKDPKKDPPHFRFESYVAMIDEIKTTGKTERTVEYRYHQKLNDDGTFIGRGDSLLKLDGSPVTDGLKKEIDEYIESKIKPEGMFPHAHFSTGYKNSKDGEVYPGVRDFIEHFRGILTWDLVHKQRMDAWDKLQLKKQIGKGVSDSERENAKKILFKLRQELKVEKGKRPELKDHETIVKLEKMEKELEEELKSKDTQQEDLNKLIKDENEFLESIKLAMAKLKMADHYDSFGNLLLPPKHEGVLKLLDIFKEYKVDSPNAKIWLEPKDLEVLARVLKSSIDTAIEMDLKKIKEEKEGEAKNTKIHEVAEKHSDNLSKAVGYFKEIPADLKERRTEFEKKHPKEFTQLSKKKDMNWVDNKDKIENIMTRVRKSLLEKSPVEDTRKERGVKIIEKSKFRSLEAFLEGELKGIYTIGQILTHASFIPKPMDATLKEKVNGEIARSEGELKKLHSTLEEMTKAEFQDVAEISDEDAKKIEEARVGIPELTHYLKSMKEGITESQKIPALGVAKVLQNKLAYFSGLYSKLTGILWFRNKPILKSAEIAEVEMGKQEGLRDRIISTIGRLARKNIFARDTLRVDMADVRGLLNKFVDGFYARKEASLPYSRILDAIQPVYYRQATSDFDKARIKSIFPADELFHAEHLIKSKLGQSEKKQLRTLAPIAQEELDKILNNVAEAYKTAFTPDRIKALAKRENIPFEQASVRLKRLEDAMAKAALGGFLLKWEDYFDSRNKPKDRSGLGNRPGEEYEKIGEYVERHIPELFTLSPTEELPEEPSRGIPTPTKIRELIEQQFSKEKDLGVSKPTEDEEEHLFFDAEYFHGGGGGGKSKGRKKPAKNPPVSGVHEVLKDRFLQVYKSKTPKEIIVDNYMHGYTIKIKDFIKSLKDDEYVEVDSVIDGYVHMLKNVYHMILSLKVEPSATAFKQPPAGAPMFSGKPDIAIDSAKEAEEVFNKIVEIYKWINFYLEPDKVGTPSKSKLTSPSGINKKYMPNYLLDWYQHMKKQEDKKASGFPMSFRVMSKFAGTGVQYPIGEKKLVDMILQE